MATNSDDACGNLPDQRVGIDQRLAQLDICAMVRDLGEQRDGAWIERLLCVYG
jgi:hypothetical protein